MKSMHNTAYTVLAIGCVFAGVTGAYLKNRYDAWRGGRFGYTRKTFLTPNEVDFYQRVLKAVAGRYHVMAQVSMGALIDTELKPAHPQYWEVRNKFALKICDFVVCDKRSLQPLLVIELDDRMHDFSKDRCRDNFLAKAGLRTVRFWSRNKPAPEELWQKLEIELNKPKLRVDANS